MKKNYQTIDAAATALAVPEAVTVAMAELVGDVQEGLLAMAVGTGLQVMAAMMDADVTAVCGPKGKHDPDRTAVRHGTENGSVTLGGRRVPVSGRGCARPTGPASCRCRPMSCSPAPRCWAGWRWNGCWPGSRPAATRSGSNRSGSRSNGPLARRASPRSRGGSSPRPRPRWPSCCPRRSGELDLVALMIDGVHFGEHLCVVALGIGIDGTKHPLGLVEGRTENTTVVTDLLTGLRDRGLDTTRPIFVGIDGAKALRAAVMRVFDHPVIGRCQLHKIRNVADKLPDHLASTVTKRMREAYHAETGAGRRGPARSAGQGTRAHPSRRRRVAARGPGRDADRAAPRRAADAGADAAHDEQHRVDDLHRPHPRGNVKNWQNGNMALRWCAAGMVEAGKQFRRVNGHLHLPALRAALDEHVAAETVGTVRHDETVIAA